MKCGRALPEICVRRNRQTDRQTDCHAHHNTRLPVRGRSNEVKSLTELHILWSELSWRELKLSPTLATAHYSCPDNAIGNALLLEAVGWKFSHRPGNPGRVGVVRWPSAGDTAGYGPRRPKLTRVFLISMGKAYYVRLSSGAQRWRLCKDAHVVWSHGDLRSSRSSCASTPL